MIVKYDALDRLEKPQLVLCNPGCTYNNGVLSNVVCPIIDHEAEEAVFNFNATSELNFRVNKPKHESELSKYYDITMLGRNMITETVLGQSRVLGLLPQTLGLEVGQEYDVEVTLSDNTIIRTRSYPADPGQSPGFTGFPSGSVILVIPITGFNNALVVDNFVLSEVYDYVLTSDTTVNPNKAYYQYINSEYVRVDNPVDQDIDTYYEVIGQDDYELTYGDGSGYLFDNTNIINIKVIGVRHESKEEFAERVYDSVQNRRLVFFKDIGFFMINSVQDGYDGNRYYKDIEAQSIDIELQQKMIPFISDGTYPFVTQPGDDREGILEQILKTIPLWQPGHIDESVASRYRTFNDISVDSNCLSFLMEQVQDAYECIIVFDIINRLVNVYDQASYVHTSNIYLSNNDLIDSATVSENADDLYTAISVTGGDDVLISAINPLGTNTIYNFSYYFDWMSNELGDKVKEWQDLIELQRDDYYDYNLTYYTHLQARANTNAEINRLRGIIDLYQQCLDNIIAESKKTLINRYNTAINNLDKHAPEIDINKSINELKSDIKGYISSYQDELDSEYGELDMINNAINNDLDNINGIREELSFNTYFSSDELAELNNYIFQGSYNDDYVVFTDQMSYGEKFAQMKILYDRAMLQLGKVSVPTQEFSIDVENFIFSKKFKHFSDSIETGCIINVELRNNDIASLFLTSMTINYDDKDFSLTFGNRLNKYDVRSLFENVLGSVSKSANTLSYVKDVIYPIKNGELDYMNEAIKSSRNFTLADIMSSVGEEVIIDAAGYTGRRINEDTGELDPHQIKIISSNIAFTNDGWDTSKLALGELNLGNGETVYGVNGEAIIGEVLIGNNLQIYSYTPETYVLTSDTTVDTSKTYYQYVDGEYVVVDNPVDQDIDTYYERESETEKKTLFDIVDGKISAAVGDTDGRLLSLETTSKDLTISVQNLENSEPDHVTTKEKRFTLNDDGLNITDSANNIKNKVDETGMYVSRSSGNYVLTEDTTVNPNKTYYQRVRDDYQVVTNPVDSAISTYYEQVDEMVLSARVDGVNALNLTSRQYLIVGTNSRFEDYGSNNERTGCFYIGENE